MSLRYALAEAIERILDSDQPFQVKMLAISLAKAEAWVSASPKAGESLVLDDGTEVVFIADSYMDHRGGIWLNFTVEGLILDTPLCVMNPPICDSHNEENVPQAMKDVLLSWIYEEVS